MSTARGTRERDERCHEQRCEAGALEDLHSSTELVRLRAESICEERRRLTAALCERGFEVTDSQANFLWAAHPAVDGGQLAARLAQAGVLVASGAALDEPGHVRVGVRDGAASIRLLNVIDKALELPVHRNA